MKSSLEYFDGGEENQCINGKIFWFGGGGHALKEGNIVTNYFANIYFSFAHISFINYSNI